MGDAVSIAPAASRVIVAVTAFRDAAPVCTALAGVLNGAPPDGPGFARSGDVLLFRLAPSRFLVMAPESDPESDGMTGRLAAALGGVAAVTDQSDAWAIFAVSGAKAHEALARVVPVDLNPRRFAPGSVALTRSGAMDVRLWKLAEGTYEVAAGRSAEADLEHALRIAARSLQAEGT